MLIESSMHGGALLGGANVLHSSFPDDAEDEFKKQCEFVLNRLDLKHLAPSISSFNQSQNGHNSQDSNSNTQQGSNYDHSVPSNSSDNSRVSGTSVKDVRCSGNLSKYSYCASSNGTKTSKVNDTTTKSTGYVEFSQGNEPIKNINAITSSGLSQMSKHLSNASTNNTAGRDHDNSNGVSNKTSQNINDNILNRNSQNKGVGPSSLFTLELSPEDLDLDLSVGVSPSTFCGREDHRKRKRKEFLNDDSD